MASHEAIAHKWANQTGKKGTGHNIFFEGPIIYSYGYHFPLGFLYEGTAYLNRDSYSVSTGKHKSIVHTAINNFTHKIFFVDTEEIKEIIHLTESNLENKEEKIKSIRLSHLRNNFYNSLVEYRKPLKRLKFQRYTNCIQELNEYRKERDLDLIGLNKEKQEKYENWEKEFKLKKEKKETKRQIKQRLENLKHNLWFVDPSKSLNQFYYTENDNVILTIKDKWIHASNGNQVELNLAIPLIKLWFSLLGKKSITEKERKINGFTGLTIRKNGTVKIGCTRILPDQVYKISKELYK